MALLKRKLNTGYQIFKSEGIGILIKRTIAHLYSSLRMSSAPDETKIIFKIFKAKQKQGVMVDVGAHFGESLEPFANCGWSVYAFEPDALNREKLINNFGQFTNVIIDSSAISDQIRSDVTFYTSKESTGISGLSSFHTSHEPSCTVNITTLDHFLKQGKIDTVDFLKIDTEGFDLYVLKGFPWATMKPQAVVCEFEDSKTEPLGYNFQELALFLQQKGYKIMISEWYPILKYGNTHDWRCFSQYPCKLHDSQAWGNVIAIREQATFNLLIETCNNIIKTKDKRWKFKK